MTKPKGVLTGNGLTLDTPGTPMTAEATATPTTLPLAADFATPTRETWLKLVDKALKGGDFEKRMVSRSIDGIRIEPLYTRADALPGADAAMPGQAPFTRGVQGNVNGLGWQIAQILAETDPAAANKAALDELAGGANALVVRCEAPGQVGLPVAGLPQALDGAILDIISVQLMAGEDALSAADAMIALWDARKTPDKDRRGAFNIDPVGALARAGGLSQSIGAATGIAARYASSIGSNGGRVTVLLADGRPYHEAGGSEAQELAGMIGTLVHYLRALEVEGVTPGAAFERIAFALAADADIFMTIAKLRAARRLIWRVADAAGAGQDARNIKLTVSTSERMMAKRDPWTNMLRTTAACAAAAFGGADAISVLPYTWALGRPDAFARRIARNTQVVLQEESGLGRVVDPAGGSWYVEKLTEELAQKAWSTFQEVEAEGGMVGCLKSGLIADQIAAVADARDKLIATGKQELTGVSAFPLLGDDGVMCEPWPAPRIAVGSARLVKQLRARRLAEPFEALRDASDAAAAKTGKRPAVFLASIGEIIDHNVRSTWVQNYLASGGIEALKSDGYATPEAAAEAFKASGATAACICSSDKVYEAKAEATAKALKAAGAKLVLQAGRPGDKEAAYKAAGVDAFLAAGQNAVDVLKGLQGKLA